MKQLVCTLLILFGLSFNAQASEPVRVDDVRLHHPYKAGVLKGATFGIYSFDRTEVIMVTPDDAQLPAGFEQYVRRHGAFAYYSGILSGFIWSFLIISFLAYGTYLRFKAVYSVPVGKEA